MNILSLSYGKDSLACIGACEKLGWPIDRIVHAEVWATDTIPADLPPMVEFKAKADKIIKDRWGIEVEHRCAMRNPQKITRGGWNSTGRLTYEEYFYHRLEKGKHIGAIKGFPLQRGPWCQNLKTDYGAKINLRKDFLSQEKKDRHNVRIPDNEGELVHRGAKDGGSKFSKSFESEVVQFLGIAADEPKRIAKHIDKPNIKLPLVEVGWTEADAKQWCIDNDLLSPIYTDRCLRGGCWFCHNQGVDQLRQLKHNYPDLWALLLRWDNDSPVSFHPDGHTVHDFDLRFELEDDGYIPADNRFRWYMMEDPYKQLSIY